MRALHLQHAPSLLHARPAAPSHAHRAAGRRCLVLASAVKPENPTASEDLPPAVGNASKPSAMDVAASSVMMPEAASSSAAAGADSNPLADLLAKIDWSEPITFDGEEKTEYDPLRDGPLRYLGYANELGEAFAAWLFPGGVPLSYAVAITYVLFDTYDKYSKTLADATAKLSDRQDIPQGVDRSKLISAIALERGLDTVVWQLIASVAVPGYTIHTIVALTGSLLEQSEKSEQVGVALFHFAAVLGMSADVLLAAINKSIPTAVGLAAIPFIVHPIDVGVHALLNATLRPAMRHVICKEARGSEAGLKICECKDCQ